MREIRVDARRGPTVSPWHLRPSEAKALDALLVTGSTKRAAAMLGVSMKTIEPALQSARDRLGVDATIHAVIKWHEWRKTGDSEDTVLRALEAMQDVDRAMRPLMGRLTNALRLIREDWRRTEARTVRAEDAAGDGVALRALHGVGELELAMRPLRNGHAS